MDGAKSECAEIFYFFQQKIALWKQNTIARWLGYKKTTEFDYLGIPLSLCKLHKGDFSKVVNKAKECLRHWGVRQLSLAGRTMLLNSSYFSLPMYLITHTNIPKSVVEAFEAAGRSFLWGSTATQKKIHYLAWSKVCQPKDRGGLGIHATSVWQGPLRARIAWSFINHDESILHTCLREKYGDNVWLSKDKRGDSITWKIIKEGSCYVDKITRWKVANGNNIDILNSRWILDRPLATWPTFVNIDYVENKRLSCMITNDRSWNLEELKAGFGKELISCIVQSPISLAEDDQMELCSSFSGRSITSLAYEATFPPEDTKFKWLKSLKVLPKVKLFWWRIVWGSLPTNEWLFARGLESTDQCFWGCNEVENIDHIICKCSKLQQVSAVFQKWGIRLRSFTNFQDCISVLSNSSHNLATLKTIFCTSIYQIWRGRNQAKHGQKLSSPMGMAAVVFGNLPHVNLPSTQEQWYGPQLNKLSSSPNWHTPPLNWLKINFDGSLLPNHAGGVGIVIRDEKGTCKKAAGKYIQHWDPGLVELHAFCFVAECIQPWMLEKDGIIIEGDNFNVIQHIQQRIQSKDWHKTDFLAPTLAVLLQCKSLLFVHVNRQCNRVANFCAQEASRLAYNFVWEDVPPDQVLLSLLLKEDQSFTV